MDRSTAAKEVGLRSRLDQDTVGGIRSLDVFVSSLGEVASNWTYECVACGPAGVPGARARAKRPP